MLAPSTAWHAPDGVDILVAILAVALLGVVVLVVSAPLRAAHRPLLGTQPVEDGGEPGGEEIQGGQTERVGDRIELETRREAKYREIRDAELDYRTGKLSKEDFAATDGALRKEAVEILDRLAALDEAD